MGSDGEATTHGRRTIGGRDGGVRPLPQGAPGKGEKLADWADGRLGLYALAKANMRKVFPDHPSFMLGEVALYSFVVLILTGVYLTLFFEPSMAEVVYHGSYEPLNGVLMTRAFESTLDISFEVRGGLLIRQIHHWAALVFVGAMIVHMMRVFFTGAFRKPRELNWVFGWTLLMLGIIDRPDRLLAPRRPAVRHRPPLRPGRDPVRPDRRDVPVLLRFRRGVSQATTSSRGSSRSMYCCCRGSCWAWWPPT